MDLPYQDSSPANDQHSHRSDEQRLLVHLVQTSESWRGQIQQSVSGISAAQQEDTGTMVQNHLGNLQVNGISANNACNQFDDYSTMVTKLGRVISSINEEERTVIMEDVTHILALVRVMCSETSQCFARDDASKTWKIILREAELIKDETTAAVGRHERAYNEISKILTDHLPQRLQFLIGVAAAVTSKAWNNRETIAKWMAFNWKGLGFGALAAAVGVGVGVGFAIGLASSK